MDFKNSDNTVSVFPEILFKCFSPCNSKSLADGVIPKDDSCIQDRREDMSLEISASQGKLYLQDSKHEPLQDRIAVVLILRWEQDNSSFSVLMHDTDASDFFVPSNFSFKHVYSRWKVFNTDIQN